MRCRSFKRVVLYVLVNILFRALTLYNVCINVLYLRGKKGFTYELKKKIPVKIYLNNLFTYKTDA